MKFIPYRVNKKDAPQSHELFKIVASDARNGGGTKGLEDFRSRMRIIDALEKYPPVDNPGLLLEDADHRKLKELVEEFPYATVRKEIDEIIRDVQDAKAPAKADKKTEAGKKGDDA
jgi:hypothetical protein